MNSGTNEPSCGAGAAAPGQPCAEVRPRPQGAAHVPRQAANRCDAHVIAQQAAREAVLPIRHRQTRARPRRPWPTQNWRSAGQTAGWAPSDSPSLSVLSGQAP